MKIVYTLMLLIISSGYALGQTPAPQHGEASYYNKGVDGHTKTANGDPVDTSKNTAASRTLPLNSQATVTDQKTGKSTDVTITDRGPSRTDRTIDLSKKAADDVGMTRSGTAPVTVTPK